MKIKVVNQRLYLEPPKTAEGTRKYLRAEFSFSEEWDGMTKTAFFRGVDGNAYSQLLKDDACTVPAEVLAVSGRVGVSVSGTLGDMVITTDIKSFSVPATLSGGTPSDPEPTLWQEVLDKFEKVSEVEEKVTELKSEIATKITAPENPEVGKVFKIKSVNDDGTFIGEWADCANLDVQIKGKSIVTDGIAEIPIANRDNVFGVVKTVPYEFWGTGVGASSNDGQLRLYPASNGNIDARQKINVSPISVNNLDYAVKAAMCDGKGAAWTEEEQASARERIGIPTDWQLVDDITIEKAVVKIAIDTDYSQYNEIMIQTMLQPNENNVLVKVISSNNPNTVDPWQSNITLLEAPKTTDKTVYSITILERNNLGIFVKKQLASANAHSVSANLIPKVAYYYTQAVPHDINGNKISANVIADDFEIICSQPQTSFKYLTIGSYKEAIAPGSKFKIYAR